MVSGITGSLGGGAFGPSMWVDWGVRRRRRARGRRHGSDQRMCGRTAIREDRADRYVRVAGVCGCFFAKVVYFEENHSTVVLRPRLRCGVCVIISILGAIEIY